MFYRPNFCCNCGEKIERTDWSVFTSRKFCDVCSLDLRFSDIFRRSALALLGLLSIAAISSAFRPADRSPKAFEDSAASSQIRDQRAANANLNATPAPLMQSQRGKDTAGNSDSEADDGSKTPPLASKTSEAVYYCGAATKKGTACSRRVKHLGERCWQHIGMPAMSDVAVTGRR
jgi:hypothetical protein